MIRVAFPLLGGPVWTGGQYYLSNLLEAVRDYAAGEIESFLFAPPEQASTAAALRPLVHGDPIVVARSGSRSGRLYRRFEAAVLQNDRLLESRLKQAGIDMVFQNSVWFGLRFGLPTLAWIPDTQHRYLPHLFDRATWLKRDMGYRAMSLAATQVMVSSEDVRRDCEKYYRWSRGKITVVPFAIKAVPAATQPELQDAQARYKLPARFFYLPSQFWKHKNHLLVVEAVRQLRDRGIDVAVVTSGNMMDNRHFEYPESVVRTVKDAGLDDRISFLGFIPRSDISLLMQLSVGVISASLFEGWSTVVEEAKSLGTPLLLSDLRVHREQAPHPVSYFDPQDAGALAQAMQDAWNGALARPITAEAATAGYENLRRRFAERFVAVCQQTLQHHRR
jgi:glycosyltransferase involved in cell wall biosynthesis